MSDLRIHYNEEMVGAAHPTKEDTLNRLVLAGHNPDGGCRLRPGWIRGFRTRYKDSTGFYVGAGELAVGGGLRCLDRERGVGHGQSSGMAQPVFLYVDPEAAGGAEPPGLNEENLVFSPAAPVWSAAGQFWRHPSEEAWRWAETSALVDGANQAVAFSASLDGRVFWLDSPVEVLSGGTELAAADVDLSPYLPALEGVEARLSVKLTTGAAEDKAGFLRKKGASGWREAGRVDAASGPSAVTEMLIPVDSGARVQYRVESLDVNMWIRLLGFSLGRP